jgi:hypothetical protein
MERPPIQCRYVLTLEEYKNSMLGHRLAQPVSMKTQFLMFCFVVLFLNLASVFPSLIKGEFSLHAFFVVFTVVNGLLLGIFVILLLVDKLRGGSRPKSVRVNRLAFLRSGMADIQITGDITPSGITITLPHQRTEWFWPSFSGGGETTTGFVLLIKPKGRQFLWLPTTGFASQQEMDDVRAILQTSIPDFSLLS